MGRPRTEPCGTPAGDSWHRARSEPVCDACRAAFNAYRRGLYAKQKGGRVRKWGPVRCGTPAGWSNHYREETPVCDACRAAHARYMASWRRKKRDKPRMAESIVDVLSTHGRWLTSDVLASLVCDLHPEWALMSVQRKALELAEKGVIARRQKMHSRRDGSFLTYPVNEYWADDEAWERVA